MEFLISGNGLERTDCGAFACGGYCEDFDICAGQCDLDPCLGHCSELCGADCGCYQNIGGTPVWLNSIS